MESDKLRWGILGTANIARAAVIPAILKDESSELTAIASRDRAKAEAWREQFGARRAYGGYAELLADPDVQAVYIPLPNSLHRAWAIRAAQAGKHVLCEKPLALNAAEAEAMAAAAQQAGVRLMEAFMYRFHPRLARLQQLLAQGVVGELKLIRSAFSFRLTRRDNIRLDAALGGGALLDVGCYCVNFSRTVAGEEPIEAQAWAVWGPGGPQTGGADERLADERLVDERLADERLADERLVDEQLVGMLRFPSGVLAQFDCALNLERREFAEVVGTDASLFLPQAFLPGEGAVVIQERRGRQGEITHPLPGGDEYQWMVAHFVAGVQRGQPFAYEAAEAAANLRAITALYQSARQGGRPVAVAGS